MNISHSAMRGLKAGLDESEDGVPWELCEVTQKWLLKDAEVKHAVRSLSKITSCKVRLTRKKYL